MRNQAQRAEQFARFDKLPQAVKAFVHENGFMTTAIKTWETTLSVQITLEKPQVTYARNRPYWSICLNESDPSVSLDNILELAGL